MWGIKGMNKYLKIHHGHVSLQRNFILAKVMHQLLLLKLLTENNRRQKATQVVGISLFLSEGKPFVVTWVPHQGISTATRTAKI